LGRSSEEAAQTRKTIVAAAADHIRRTGIAEASLADIMAAAGLTHGGFYRHFRNKEQLVAEAISAAGTHTIETITRAMAKGGFDAAVDAYLAKSHRDARTPICPFAAVGSDMARSASEVKAAGAVLERLLGNLGDGEARPATRADAIAAFATMIGAMILARIASGTSLSDEVLESAKDHLHRSAIGNGPRRKRK
jgi:TetR/AcrR family transcriptional repressor of nem operon